MNKLWEHIENILPGLVLFVSVFFLMVDVHTLTVPEILKHINTGQSALVAGVLLAFAYMIGVANAPFARLLFTEIPIMDSIRLWYFIRAMEGDGKSECKMRRALPVLP